MESSARDGSSGAAAGATGGGARGGTGGRRGTGRGGGGDNRNSSSKGKRPARSSPGQGSSSAYCAPAGAGGVGTGGDGAARGGGDSYSALGQLVSKATKPTRETGYKRLHEDTVRRIKAIARRDESCAAGAIRYLMQRMTAKSAEVRFMALSIVGLLFQRSRVVRKALVADLKNFINLGVGHDVRHPLPGPPAAAAALRQKALALMEEWNGSHGDLYKGLRVAYRFLREGKRMKFPELQARAARERQAAARRQKHAQRLVRAKYVQAKAEIAEQASEIETIVREMRECFAILVPAVPGSDAISIDQGHDEISRGDRMGGGGGKASDCSCPLPPRRDSIRSPQEPSGAAAARDEDHRRQDGRRGGGGGYGSADEEYGSDRCDASIPGGVGPSSSSRRRTDSGLEGVEKRGRQAEGGHSSGRGQPKQRGGAEAGESRQDDDSINININININKQEAREEGREGQAMAPAGGVGVAGAGGAAAAATESDDDEGMEWEDGGGGDGDDAGGIEMGEIDRWEQEAKHEKDEEEEEGEGEGEWDEEKHGKRRWSGGVGDDDALLTIADTVEAAGLGSSGYELQVEVPMGWSVTTSGGDGGGGGSDAALVVSALRERYKVLTSRLLPLLSDWIQTLSRVHFDDDDDNQDSSASIDTTTTTTTARGREGRAERRVPTTTTAAVPVSVAERRACASLLSRCLALRNSANTLVSKFVELRIDADEGGRGGGGSSSAGPAAKQPRLEIRMNRA